ncbi:hypothetical protein PSN13_06505 [Micromonospora saelicesensis]|uniref:Uncharacterized protein n=1 Tax=Micromonospora saelicesensis TaxID=285676 RepID=A0A328NC20_9ACTN|nr:hypothetical protein [Micromonospora saelicesensis]RAO26477.1 hypothetical protein PSN13_06505 [Micromonospora saelicesensis]
MPVLFELTQLASYMQTSELDSASGALARDLVTILIRNEVGATRYDALVDLTPFLPVALDVASRILDPNKGKKSTTRQIDDYSETDSYASDSPGAPELTESEAARVRAAAGLSSSGAFTIRPAAPAGCDLVRHSARWWQ